MRPRNTQSNIAGQLLAGIALLLFITGLAAQEDADSGSELSRFDAFDQARSEQLLQQGQQEMREGLFELAERTFLEAMQIAKINFGLNAPQQRLPLEYAIRAQLAQGKWDEVGTHFSYFEWLNDEVYPRDFYEYLKGTEQLSSMLLRASADPSNPMAVRYLINAKNLNWRAVNGIEATLGENHIELAPWLYNIVLTHYYQSSLLRPANMTSHVYRNDSEEMTGWTLHLSDTQRISYRIGRELLARITSIYQQASDSPDERQALAKVHQADWEILFGNEAEAFDLYRSAFATLLESGLSAEQANLVFERPMVIPANKLSTRVAELTANQLEGPVRFHAWTPNFPATPLPSESVAINSSAGSETLALLRFDLHPLLPNELLSTGRTVRLGFNLAGLEVVSVAPDSDQIRERARREVSLLQFRPKLDNGEPVALKTWSWNIDFRPVQQPDYYRKLTMRLITSVCLIALVSTSCAVEPGRTASRQPTDAEVEAYNATAAPGERIVCKKEAPNGSHIRRRVCRLERNMNEATAAIQHELRRVRSSTL